LADRTISLSEKTRATELEDDRLRAALRKAEIRSRREREPVFHEITLKDADKPGLPEPKASRSVIAATRRDQRALQAVGREATAVRRDGQAAADEDGEGEEEGVAADVNLREAERIVIDYAQFATGRRNVASSAPAGKPAAN
jgi:hypothetical protein